MIFRFEDALLVAMVKQAMLVSLFGSPVNNFVVMIAKFRIIDDSTAFPRNFFPQECFDSVDD